MLFTREDVEEGLRALVEELDQTGVESRIYVVGGAAIILQAAREALTGDVDTLQFANLAIQPAVDRVAQMKQWPTTWLNDAAKMWASHFDTEDDWEVRVARGLVEVLVARAPLLLAMKLRAGRGRRDASDIELLIGECGIGSLNAAVSLFETYYPTESIAPKAMRQLIERFGERGDQ